MAKTWE